MKLNNDFKYSIQIPKFLTHEKCDELKEQIFKDIAFAKEYFG